MLCTLWCLPVTPAGNCSLIKAIAKMKEFSSAAPRSRSVTNTQFRDEGWEKTSCHGMSQLTQPWLTMSCWDVAAVPKPRGQQRQKLRLSLLIANSFFQWIQQLFSGLAAAQHGSPAAEEELLPVTGTGVGPHLSAVELCLGNRRLDAVWKQALPGLWPCWSW